MVTSRKGNRPFRIFWGNFSVVEKSEKWSLHERYDARFAGGENNLSRARQHPKNFNSRTGNWPFCISEGNIFRCLNVGKMFNSRTVARLFQRNVQKLHFEERIPAVSSFWRRYHFPKSSKNIYFTNGNRAGSPDARTRFLWLRNFQKWSLCEWEPDVL